MTTATDHSAQRAAPARPALSVLFPEVARLPDTDHADGTPGTPETTDTPEARPPGRTTVPDMPTPPDPGAFVDLNLDQVIRAVTRWRDDYDLVPLFEQPVRDPEVIRYRHEVMRDLDDRQLVDAVHTFARGMRMVRQYRSLADTIAHRQEKAIWFLESARAYVTTVMRLADDLREVELGSRGLRRFRDHLDDQVVSSAFVGLVDDANEVSRQLSTVTYRLHVEDLRVTVTADDDPVDYGEQVEATFERFRQSTGDDRRREPATTGRLNDVEAAVLTRVARLHPETFATLDRFCERHADHRDPTVTTFDREIQFYLAYLDFITPIRGAGLALCYPEVDGAIGELVAVEAFDLALASKLVARGEQVVCNDIMLSGPERILVVTGANQGGKTTFARAVGQLHHLASIGCPVPAREARLRLPDRLYTHFAHEERLEDRRGRLQDDLIRVHGILEHATADSVVILNEIFSSTTLADARELGTRVLEQLQQRDLIAVYVTFVDELATLGPKTVSLVAAVDADDPAVRTFEVLRRPADGRAFARALADKHGLSYERLAQRLGAGDRSSR